MIHVDCPATLKASCVCVREREKEGGEKERERERERVLLFNYRCLCEHLLFHNYVRVLVSF